MWTRDNLICFGTVRALHPASVRAKAGHGRPGSGVGGRAASGVFPPDPTWSPPCRNPDRLLGGLWRGRLRGPARKEPGRCFRQQCERPAREPHAPGRCPRRWAGQEGGGRSSTRAGLGRRTLAGTPEARARPAAGHVGAGRPGGDGDAGGAARCLGRAQPSPPAGPRSLSRAPAPCPPRRPPAAHLAGQSAPPPPAGPHRK